MEVDVKQFDADTSWHVVRGQEPSQVCEIIRVCLGDMLHIMDEGNLVVERGGRVGVLQRSHHE